jgi:hypothetical protein
MVSRGTIVTTPAAAAAAAAGCREQDLKYPLGCSSILRDANLHINRVCIFSRSFAPSTVRKYPG